MVFQSEDPSFESELKIGEPFTIATYDFFAFRYSNC